MDPDSHLSVNVDRALTHARQMRLRGPSLLAPDVRLLDALERSRRSDEPGQMSIRYQKHGRQSSFLCILAGARPGSERSRKHRSGDSSCV